MLPSNVRVDQSSILPVRVRGATTAITPDEIEIPDGPPDTTDDPTTTRLQENAQTLENKAQSPEWETLILDEIAMNGRKVAKSWRS